MGVFNCIKNRRSVRKFEEREVSHEVLMKLVDAGRWAPSGSNIQSLHYIIVKKISQIQRIKGFSPGMSGHPPAVIIICSDLELAERKGGKLGRELLILFDAAMSAQNIMLMATELGLGTCVIRSFNQLALQTILTLPEAIMPQLLITVGHPAHISIAPQRKELESIVHWEKFQNSR